MVNSQSMPKVDKDGIVNCRVWKAAVAWSLNMSSAGDCQSQFSGSLDVNVRELLAMSCHNESFQFQSLSLSNGMLLYADSTMNKACQKKICIFMWTLTLSPIQKQEKLQVYIKHQTHFPPSLCPIQTVKLSAASRIAQVALKLEPRIQRAPWTMFITTDLQRRCVKTRH